MKYLLSGGAGYLGLHIALELIESGKEVLIIDNFSNSNEDNLKLLSAKLKIKLNFKKGDIRDEVFIDSIFKKNKIDGVIHLAGLKSIPQSVLNPLSYFDNNVHGTINLLNSMNKYSVKTLVFSSSASVYGDPEYLPIDESHQTITKNPYASTKLQIENMLEAIAGKNSDWKIISLRYFNPVGGHDNGLLGDSTSGIPDNLMPYITAVAAKQMPYLKIFGKDYKTNDGTGVRDYIHVMDLAESHLSALNFLQSKNSSIYDVFNIGTGYGYSVLEIVSAFEESTNIKIPIKFLDRRAGDVSACYANVQKAEAHLNWIASKNLQDMCLSAWHFKRNKA